MVFSCAPARSTSRVEPAGAGTLSERHGSLVVSFPSCAHSQHQPSDEGAHLSPGRNSAQDLPLLRRRRRPHGGLDFLSAGSLSRTKLGGSFPIKCNAPLHDNAVPKFQIAIPFYIYSKLDVAHGTDHVSTYSALLSHEEQEGTSQARATTRHDHGTGVGG